MGEIESIIEKVNPRYKEPVWENKITYNTASTTLEPLYYWIIDFLEPYKPEKLVDSFTAAPGSSYFRDLGMRATKMQEEGMKILGLVAGVVKGIINLLYDLRNFDQRLGEYKKAGSKDLKEKAIGINALKQIWLNSVDSLRGLGGLNNMAQSPQPGFTLLRPAFMYAHSPAAVEGMDLNDMVKRVLKPRIAEFFDWVKLSEAELKKRYEIQRSYLKSQVATLQLYSKWVKPYLIAAEQLRMKENKEPSLVSVFGSMVLELGLLGKMKIDVKDEAKSQNLPPYFEKMASKIREMHQIVIVNFKFRTFPTQQAPHAGRVDINFKAYAFNDDELMLFNKLKEDDDLDALLKVSETVAGESLKTIREEVDNYLSGESEEKEKKKEGIFEEIFKDIKKNFVQKTRTEKEKEEKEKKAKEAKEEKEKIKKLIEEGISDDTREEGVVREFAEMGAAEFCYKIYSTFKKSMGMVAFPSQFGDLDAIKKFRQKRAEINALLKK